jgi:hypothetical protein
MTSCHRPPQSPHYLGWKMRGKLTEMQGRCCRGKKRDRWGGKQGRGSWKALRGGGDVINTNAVDTKTCADKNTNRPLVWFDKPSPCSSNCASYRVTTGCSVTLSSTAAAAEDRPVGDIMAASPRSCPRYVHARLLWENVTSQRRFRGSSLAVVEMWLMSGCNCCS